MVSESENRTQGRPPPLDRTNAHSGSSTTTEAGRSQSHASQGGSAPPIPVAPVTTSQPGRR